MSSINGEQKKQAGRPAYLMFHFLGYADIRGYTGNLAPKRIICYTNSMKKQQAIQTLTNSQAELAKRYGVSRLALFGSTARDDATASSDVDILAQIFH